MRRLRPAGPASRPISAPVSMPIAVPCAPTPDVFDAHFPVGILWRCGRIQRDVASVVESLEGRDAVVGGRLGVKARHD